MDYSGMNHALWKVIGPKSTKYINTSHVLQGKLCNGVIMMAYPHLTKDPA